MRVIVSTCGTSVLTHQTPDEFRTLLNRLSNRQQDELGEHLSAVEAHIAQRRDQMRTADIETARKMSAELNGILGVYGGTLPPEARSDRHLLVASDTYLGNTCARIVADWLTANGIPDVQVCVIKNLVTDSLETFRFGVQELVQWCEETLPGHRKTYRIIFNLTGGFKGVQGVMNTLAHAYADEIVYIFETGRDLLRIPTLPLNWDPVAIARAPARLASTGSWHRRQQRHRGTPRSLGPRGKRRCGIIPSRRNGVAKSCPGALRGTPAGPALAPYSL